MSNRKNSATVQESRVLQKNSEAIRILDKWLSDQSDYDRKIWPTVKQSIEDHRLSSRPRFQNEEHHS